MSVSSPGLELVGDVGQSATRSRPIGKAIEPPDQIVRFVRMGQHVVHHGAQVGSASRLDAHIARVDRLGLEPQAGDAAQKPHAPDHRPKEGLIALPGDRAQFTRGQDQVELQNLVPGGTDLEVVFAVHVHGGHTRQGRRHGAGHHAGPLAHGQDVLPQLLDADPALQIHLGVLGVDLQDPVEPGAIDHNALVRMTGVPIAPPGTAHAHLQASLGTGEQKRAHLFGVARVSRVRERARGHAPALLKAIRTGNPNRPQDLKR